MQTPELESIPLHEEIVFFRPVLATIRKLLDVVESKQGTSVQADVNAFYVPSQGQQRAITEMHLASSEWLPIRDYLMGKSPLHFFYEPQMSGLVYKEGCYWIFPAIEQLNQYCYRERLKLNELSPKSVRKLPFQNLEPHFQKEIAELLNHDEKLYSMRAQECERHLKLARFYLPKSQYLEIQTLARIMLKLGLHHEIQDLIRINKEKVMVDRMKLKKRVRAVHTLSMKYYFFNVPDEEKQKIDGLVDRDESKQLKALEYIERKVGKSFSINNTHDQLKKIQQTISDRPVTSQEPVEE
ncbi:MAG: hypothetical protein HQM11_20785 [SAR324 cluster bacterium]|nr:hypothetical protein [SAR324 cluster bacterium]